MRDELGPKLIGAVVATVALMGALGLYLGNRDRIVAGAEGELHAYLEDYAANHSMISREKPANAPEMKPYEVYWQCRDEPQYARVTSGYSPEDAIRQVKRTVRGKGCQFLKAIETTKPYCPTRDTCGHKRIVEG